MRDSEARERRAVRDGAIPVVPLPHLFLKSSIRRLYGKDEHNQDVLLYATNGATLLSLLPSLRQKVESLSSCFHAGIGVEGTHSGHDISFESTTSS